MTWSPRLGTIVMVIHSLMLVSHAFVQQPLHLKQRKIAPHINGEMYRESLLNVKIKAMSFQSTKGNTNEIVNSFPPQLVQFREPRTNTTVILIGTMHYNPTSIQMVKDTIQTLAMQNTLGSVIVESCDIRWNSTMEILKTKRGKLLEPVLKSEMKVACDEALKYGRPCVLGDQRINATGVSLKNNLRQTFVDITSPFNGGVGEAL